MIQGRRFRAAATAKHQHVGRSPARGSAEPPVPVHPNLCTTGRSRGSGVLARGARAVVFGVAAGNMADDLASQPRCQLFASLDAFG